MVKNPPANAGDAGDMGLISGSGRSPGGRNGNPLEYSCLKNSLERDPGWLQSVGCKESYLTEHGHIHAHVCMHTHTRESIVCLHDHVTGIRGSLLLPSITTE